MHREGHVGLTLTILSISYYILNVWNFRTILILLISTLFSTLPDFDIKIQRRSKFFRNLGILLLPLSILTFKLTYLSLTFLFLSLTFLLLSLVHHRGITHTLTFALLCGVTSGFITLTILKDFYVGFLGAFIGVTLHIFGDTLTYKPLSPFYPFSNVRFSLKLFKSSNRIVNRSLMILGLATLVTLYKGGIILRQVLRLGC